MTAVGGFKNALPSQKIFLITFCLYIVSLATSMAGMELFSTLLGLQLLLQEKKSLHWPPFSKPLLLFSAIILVGIWINDASLDQKLYDSSRLRFFLIYAILYFSLQKIQNHQVWIKPLALVCLGVGIYGLIQHFIPLDIIRPEGKKVLLFAVEETKTGPLTVGFFNHHLTFANIFLFHALLFISLALYAPQKNKVLFFFLGLLLLLDCIWTQSRMAWFAVPLCLLVLLFPKGKKWILGAGALCIILFGTLFFVDSGFRGRIHHTWIQPNPLYNLSRRSVLWQAQWQMFKDHPVFGIGYNNNERHAKEYVDKYSPHAEKFYGHAHSTPLQILSSTGILGSVAYLFLWIQIFGAVIKIIRASSRPSVNGALGLFLLAAYTGFWIQGLTQWNFGDAEVLHNLMFFWGLTAFLYASQIPQPSLLNQRYNKSIHS